MHVGAVGDHNSHGDAQTEEELSHGIQKYRQEPGQRHILKAGDNVYSESLQTGPGDAGLIRMADGEGEDGDDDYQNKQDRHKDLGRRFDSFIDAPEHDEGHREQKHQQHDNGLRLRGDKARKVSVLRRLGTVPRQIYQKIFDHPAADGTVVGQDDYRDQTGDHAQALPFTVQLPICRQGTLLCLPPDGHLRDQQCKTKGQRKNNVDDEEHASPVLGCQVGKSPDISQADGAPRRRKHKTDRTCK